jgi:hypothetical protein
LDANRANELNSSGLKGDLKGIEGVTILAGDLSGPLNPFKRMLGNDRLLRKGTRCPSE